MALMCLAPGVTIDAAEAALDGITRRLDEQDPSAPTREDKAKRVVLLPAGTRAPIPRENEASYSRILCCVDGPCHDHRLYEPGNHASRARRQSPEGVRDSPLRSGASRFRLVRQMVSEGILLSLLGGIAGFALAYGLSVLNSHIPQPAGEPLQPIIALDWRAAVFAFAVAVVCGIGFSLAPALQATNVNLLPALKEGLALQLPGYRRFGLRNVAMVTQLTGSLMLLLITGFLVLGFIQVNSIETRFNPKDDGSPIHRSGA